MNASSTDGTEQGTDYVGDLVAWMTGNGTATAVGPACSFDKKMDRRSTMKATCSLVILLFKAAISVSSVHIRVGRCSLRPFYL
jgi:hypothetical protein